MSRLSALSLALQVARGGNRFVNNKSTTLRANMGDNKPAVCFTVKTKQIDMRTEEEIAHPLDSNDDKEPQAVCYKTRHDVTGDSELSLPLYVLEGNGSRDSHQGPGYAVGDTMYTLNTVEHHAVCYAIEGHVVDRNTRNNGKGWCVDVSPTLNTQDRHAIAFQLCGDRSNPSVSSSEKAYCLPANPMSDCGQAVVFRKVCNEGNDG